MAAAVTVVGAGHHATVFEAARTVGGRARALVASASDDPPLVLDNGQHILIGAYTQALRLMRHVGVDTDTALLRLPLTLRFPDGTGLQWPRLSPPWDALWGILGTHSWSWGQRLALLRAALGWRIARFRCPADTTVAQLCAKLPAELLEGFIEPLCVAALNTPAHAASGQVFLRVLQDSLFSGPGGSNLLLPRVNMGELFPEAAARWLRAQGSNVRTATRVRNLTAMPQSGRWVLDGNRFDAVVLAVPSHEAVRLVSRCLPSVDHTMTVPLCDWAATAQALSFEAIATVYLQAPADTRLAQPMLALRSSTDQPAQFVFDRGQLGGPAGLLAAVVSASQGDRATLEQQVREQIAQALGLSELHVLQTVIEKRATFACTPQLQRPSSAIAPGLWACGDYIDGPYPATLEGAVRSGMAAAQQAVIY